MTRLLRYVVVGLLLLLLFIGIVVLWIALTRGRTPPITDESGRVVQPGIAMLERINLGGAEQWVLIRGHDTSKPVLLFLHGGPGMPAMFLAHAFQRKLERDFVVVHWDRRGAGKSYDPALPIESLNVRQLLDDLYELTRLLRQRFGNERIYLVGHSWGTYLGLLAVQEHPEYYCAYVGMGQLAGTEADVVKSRREFIARKAAEAGHEELGRKVMSGEHKVSEDDLFYYGGALYKSQSFWPLLITGMRAPEYTLTDILNVKKATEFVNSRMQCNVTLKPLGTEIAEFDVPLFFFLGRRLQHAFDVSGGLPQSAEGSAQRAGMV